MLYFVANCNVKQGKSVNCSSAWVIFFYRVVLLLQINYVYVGFLVYTYDDLRLTWTCLGFLGRQPSWSAATSPWQDASHCQSQASYEKCARLFRWLACLLYFDFLMICCRILWLTVNRMNINLERFHTYCLLIQFFFISSTAVPFCYIHRHSLQKCNWIALWTQIFISIAQKLKAVKQQ